MNIDRRSFSKIDGTWYRCNVDSPCYLCCMRATGKNNWELPWLAWEITQLIYLHADEGSYKLEPAFGYGPLKLTVKGELVAIPHTNHQAVQMDSVCPEYIRQYSGDYQWHGRIE